IDRQVRRTRSAEAGVGAVLQPERPAFDRSGAADPDADRRLLLRHSLGTAALRRSPPEPSVPLVLRFGPRRRGARSFDLLEEPAWPLPRQRFAAALVRDGPTTVHR